MKKNSARIALGIGLLVATPLVSLSCGSDESDEPDPGFGGSGGSSAGTGGSSAGTGGTGDTGGTGGTGGTTGTGGDAGNAGGQGGAAGTGAMGGSGASGGACVQADQESNDTEVAATDLGTIDDCDGSGSTLEGTVGDDVDQDWFRFAGTDTIGCRADPTVDLTSAATLQMCMFVECENGTTEVTCEPGSFEESSPNGRLGCCTTTPNVAPTVNCAGTGTENETIWIRISAHGNASCANYTLDYHY